MIRLVAIDMDGTLLDSKNRISAKNRNAVREAKAQGVRVVLSSGRTTGNLRTYLKELGLSDAKEYVVGYNGALALEAWSGRILHHDMLTKADVLRITGHLEAMGANYSVHTLEDVWIPREHPIARYEAEVNGVPVVLRHPDGLPADALVPKIIVLDEEEILDRHEKALPDWLRAEYTVVRSQDIFLDVLKKGVSKYRGVQAVARELGIDTAEILALGDAENDRVLLSMAGVGVAMGNASEAIQAVADYTTRTNDQDGVAHALKRFLNLNLDE